MAGALAMSAETKGKVYTGGAAFITGWAMGWAINKYPAVGIMGSVLVSVIGLVGSLATRGTASEMLEGVGAAGLASIGASMPSLITQWTGGTAARAQLGAGRNVPLLGAGSPLAQPMPQDVLRNYQRGGI
jgi:hypothetical protein